MMKIGWVTPLDPSTPLWMNILLIEDGMLPLSA
jgi:hypothetical protein